MDSTEPRRGTDAAHRQGVNAWYATTQRLPVFADQRLTVPTVVHGPKCQAQAHEDGVVSTQSCRCHSAKTRLDPAQPVCLISMQDERALVHEQDSGLFWVESSSLIPTAAPPPPPEIPLRIRRAPPADYIEVEASLGEPAFKLPRRRRRIQGGEIVFIRADYSDKTTEPVPWRFFGLTFVNNMCAILLIDASLRFDGDLEKIGWPQQRTLILGVRNGKDVEPHQLLIPVFPLPNGTEDPGWEPS